MPQIEIIDEDRTDPVRQVTTHGGQKLQEPNLCWQVGLILGFHISRKLVAQVLDFYYFASWLRLITRCLITDGRFHRSADSTIPSFANDKRWGRRRNRKRTEIMSQRERLGQARHSRFAIPVGWIETPAAV